MCIKAFYFTKKDILLIVVHLCYFNIIIYLHVYAVNTATRHVMLWSHKVARPATHTLRPILLPFRVASLRQP